MHPIEARSDVVSWQFLMTGPGGPFSAWGTGTSKSSRFKGLSATSSGQLQATDDVALLPDAVVPIIEWAPVDQVYDANVPGSQGDIMTVKRMDNVGIVVEDIDAAIEFFTELGLNLEGRAPIEGDWADGVTGLRDMRVEIAMMRTPDGHSRLELSRFLAPTVVADHRNAPVNALGYLRVMFAVEDIDDTLARLGKRGAELVGEVVQYKNSYRLCYIRGPEGILIGLAQELGQQTSR